ncbi:MAG TPA: CBS domain-containing protein, partial [Nitrososphaera sp.]|nr:CBS domain-containing protein [Nitrososphaera sp.]
MELILNLLLIALFLGCVLLSKAYQAVSLRELKRRARGTGDVNSLRIYKMASYQKSLEAFLWLVGGTSLAALLIVAARYSWWVILIAVLGATRLVWPLRPLRSSDSTAWRLAATLAPPVTALVGLLHPILRRIPSPRGPGHTGVYEKQDLLEFINRQNQQADSRINDDELRAAFSVLTFADKQVTTAMTPKKDVKMVAESDSIGPHLMDELHSSGFGRFPVVKKTEEKGDKIVGVLYLSEVVDHPDKGKVRDIMRSPVCFINETQNLKDALGAFLRTGSQLLVVVNNFEEIVGIITIEDVLEQILGEKIVDEFDHYDDMRTVAGLDTKDESHKQSTA